jgi:hypothetical protein
MIFGYVFAHKLKTVSMKIGMKFPYTIFVGSILFLITYYKLTVYTCTTYILQQVFGTVVGDCMVLNSIFIHLNFSLVEI